MSGEYREANPDAKQVRLSKEEKEQSAWSIDGVTVRLGIDVTGLDCGLQEALELNGVNNGDSIVISPRLTVDDRKPDADRVPFTPTPKQLLYGTRGSIERIVVDRNEDCRAMRAFVEIRLSHSNVGTLPGGFIFASMTGSFAVLRLCDCFHRSLLNFLILSYTKLDLWPPFPHGVKISPTLVL